MNKLILKVIFGLAFSSGFATAQTQGMLPMVDVVKGVNLTNPDNSTIGFIGTRCGTLFMTISGYFAGNANKDSERQTAKDFMDKAEVFSFVGVFLDTGVNKKTNDAVKTQGEALSKAYIDEMLAGKRLNNNVFTKLIQSDVNFCVSQYPAYTAYYKTIMDSVNSSKKSSK